VAEAQLKLIDAINSGCDFRVKGDDHSMWMYVDPNGLDGCTPAVRWRCADDGKLVHLTPYILEEDFEIKEIAVTVTRKELWDAVAKILRVDDDFRCSGYDYVFDELATHLGLGRRGKTVLDKLIEDAKDDYR
jgi:hypothetical protein